jgi:hypothetical protein
MIYLPFGGGEASFIPVTSKAAFFSRFTLIKRVVSKDPYTLRRL